MNDDVVPEQPTSGEIMRAIGRVEKSLDQQGGKLDRLDDKLDGHADYITRHELRIAALEKKDDAQQTARASLSVQVKAALVAGALGIGGGITGALISLAHH